MKLSMLLGALYLLAMVGCKPKAVDPSLSAQVIKGLSRSLDINKKIGPSYKCINYKIKNRTLIVKAVNEAEDCYLFIISLKTGNVTHIIPDPLNDFISTLYEVHGDTLFVVSAMKPDTLYAIGLKNNSIKKRAFDLKKTISPGDILMNDKQLFSFKDVYGVGAVNRDSLKLLLFHSVGVVSAKVSTLSFPVSDSLNLLSGHSLNRSVITLHAIDGSNNIKWGFPVFCGVIPPKMSILSGANLFLVASGSDLVAINKSDGGRSWQKTFEGEIVQLSHWEDKIVAYGLSYIKRAAAYGENSEYKLTVKVLNSTNGAELMVKELVCVSVGVPDIANINGRVLVSDSESFSEFSLKDGNGTFGFRYPQEQKDAFKFGQIMDSKTGEYYVDSFDGMIYW